jgi:TRAP-type C4-dicarboxylate transport system substrate-binding protein
MKRIVWMVLMAVSLVFGLQYRAAAEEWPLAILWPTNNFATQGAFEFAKIVKEKSGGKLNITVQPGGALGYKGPEMLRVVKDGMVPIGEMLLGYVSGTEPILGLSTMPLLVSNAKEAHNLGVVAKPSTEKVFAKWNQKLIYWHFWPGAGLYTKKPVKSLADLKGLKIRAFDAISTDWVKAAGAQPVTMPWGDVYMALFTGSVDAVLTSSVSGVDGKFWEVTPYFTDMGFTFGYSAVTVNLNAFNKLPDNLKKILTDAGYEMGPKQEDRAMSADKTALAELTKNGIKVGEMSPAFRQECVKVAESIWASWAKSVGGDAQTLINEVRKGAGK